MFLLLTLILIFSVPVCRHLFNIIYQMNKLTVIFWALFWLFVYKLAFLEGDSIPAGNRFSIYRDSEGIPHVFAKSYQDLFYGLGFAQGQDRLWTLYFKKMFIEGRVAQMFGAAALPSDLEMRNMGFMEMGKRNKEHTDTKTLAYLQAYTDGLNAYAHSSKMLPMEFYLFWLPWEDWQVEDSLAIINLLSFTLQFDWFYEIARQRLLQTVGFDLGVKTITYGGANLFRNTTIVSDEELKEMGLYKKYDFKEQIEVLKKHWAANNISLGSVNFPSFQFAVQGSGSNSWVIGGQHTKNGKPILASDPHLGSVIPSLFYCHESILLTEDNQVKSRKFGVMPDGLPTVSIGISEVGAWGSTAAYIDNKDVYYETIRNESGKFQYKFKDQWFDFRERKELIKVRGAADVEEVFYHTHRGVVIESIFMDIHWKYGYPLPDKYRDNHTLTLVPAHYRPDNTSAFGLTSMITFQSLEEWIDASYSINFPNIDGTFIMPNGSFGYTAVGAIPKRRIPEMGSFIKDGNTDIYDMGEYLTRDEKPKLLDSKRGYVTMCNNRFVSDNFEHRSSLHEIVTGRSYRLDKIVREKIEKGEKFDLEETKRMQLDFKDEFVAQVLPVLLAKLTHLRKLWSSPETEAIFERLQSWDHVMGRDSIEPSYYHVWQYNFQHSLFQLVKLNQEEIHAIINHGFFENYQFTLLQKVAKGGLSEEEYPVCESLETRKYANYHPCEVSVALAFKNLPHELKNVFGSNDHSTYTWGSIHNQIYKIVPYGDIPLLNKIWQRNFPVGGNSRTLNVAIQTHQSKSYNSIGSPAFRFVTDTNTTYFGLEMGESDRIFSPYYDNFANTFRYVQYIPRNPYQEGLPEGWKLSVDALTK